MSNAKQSSGMREIMPWYFGELELLAKQH